MVSEIVRYALVDYYRSSEPAEVIFSGKIVGESGMRYLDDIGLPVTHNYEVSFSINTLSK